MAKVFMWDTGNSTGDITGHSKRVLSASYKPTRPFRIMTGGEDAKTIFHTGPPFKLDHSNPVHSNFVNGVRYSPNGLLIVSVSSDKKIQFYDGVSGQPTHAIPDAHNGSIYSVSWSADSTRISTASADKSVKIWEVSTLQCVRTLNITSNLSAIGDMQVPNAVQTRAICRQT